MRLSRQNSILLLLAIIAIILFAIVYFSPVQPTKSESIPEQTGS